MSGMIPTLTVAALCIAIVYHSIGIYRHVWWLKKQARKRSDLSETFQTPDTETQRSDLG